MAKWVVPETGVDQLLQDSREIERHHIAASSRRTYDAGMSVYRSSMTQCALEPYPVTEDKIRIFIELARTNSKTYSYISSLIQSLAFYFRENSLPDLTKTPKFEKYKEGLRRTMLSGTHPKARLPVTPKMMARMHDLSDGTEDRYHAEAMMAFKLMFLGFLRVSELCDLKWDDVVSTRLHFSITIRKSKTDQLGQGLTMKFLRRADSLDLPTAYAVFTIWNAPAKGQRFFRHRADWVRHAIKVYAARLNEDPVKYSGHSFRKGGARAAFESGIPDSVIKVHGRWSSSAYERYIDVQQQEAADRVVTGMAIGDMKLSQDAHTV